MLPPNPAEKLFAAPVADLVSVLLKQFKRLLHDRDIILTTADIESIGQAVAVQDPLPEKAETVRAAVIDLVKASEDELQQRFGRSFAQSLTTDMNSIGGWETTADFLEIANHKSNAELRISAGASLLVFLGDLTRTDHLLTVIRHDAGAHDVDAAFAIRALAHRYAIDSQRMMTLSADDWQQILAENTPD